MHGPVARMKRSKIRGRRSPHSAALHAGYDCAPTRSSNDETPRAHRATGRCGDLVHPAACLARAAARADAAHRDPHELGCGRCGRTGPRRGVPAGAAGTRLVGRVQSLDRCKHPPRSRYRQSGPCDDRKGLDAVLLLAEEGPVFAAWHARTPEAQYTARRFRSDAPDGKSKWALCSNRP